VLIDVIYNFFIAFCPYILNIYGRLVRLVRCNVSTDRLQWTSNERSGGAPNCWCIYAGITYSCWDDYTATGCMTAQRVKANLIRYSALCWRPVTHAQTLAS